MLADEAANWVQRIGIPAVSDSSNDGYSSLEIQARCWQGNLEDRPTDNSKILTMKKKVTDDTLNGNERNIVAGRLPDVDYTGNILGRDEYSCNFGFQQEITDSSLLPLGDDAFTPFGDATTTSCSIDDPCYIVAGTNNEPPVRVTIDSVNPSISGNGNPRTDLIGDAENTDNPGYNSVFTNFPDRSFGSEVARNPFDVWSQLYG